MNALLFLSLFISAAPQQCGQPLSVHATSDGCGHLPSMVCSYMEDGRGAALDFLTITPCYDTSALTAGELTAMELVGQEPGFDRYSLEGITAGYRTEGHTIEYTFTFPDGEEPVILMDVPSVKDSITGELHFMRAGVPDGDRKYGRIVNRSGGAESCLVFDFSASREYGWITGDGPAVLTFPAMKKKNTVTFTVTVSSDPSETYGIRTPVPALDFSKASGHADISWDILAEYVSENPSSVSWAPSTCPDCGERAVQIHYVSPPESWKNLCGREGIVLLCPHCMKQIGFYLLKMN